MLKLPLPTLFLGLLASTAALALPEAPPPHSVSPELNGLNIATFVKKDRIKIALYVINHEKFEVVCDADYKSGPDQQDSPEITIPGGKADAFRFTFGRRGDEVVLRLVCIDPRSTNAREKDPATQDPVSTPPAPAEAPVPTPDQENPYRHDTP